MSPSRLKLPRKIPAALLLWGAVFLAGFVVSWVGSSVQSDTVSYWHILSLGWFILLCTVVVLYLAVCLAQGILETGKKPKPTSPRSAFLAKLRPGNLALWFSVRLFSLIDDQRRKCYFPAAGVLSQTISHRSGRVCDHHVNRRFCAQRSTAGTFMPYLAYAQTDYILRPRMTSKAYSHEIIGGGTV